MVPSVSLSLPSLRAQLPYISPKSSLYLSYAEGLPLLHGVKGGGILWAENFAFFLGWHCVVRSSQVPAYQSTQISQPYSG